MELIPDNRTDLQRLQEYLIKGGGVDGLSDKQREMWDKVLAVDGIIRQYVSPKDQLEIMRSHELLKNMSRTQLWRYRDAAQEIIGYTEKNKKPYLRLIAAEKIAKGFTIAEKNDDGRLWAAMVKEYIKLNGLDNHDEDAAHKPEPPANILVLVADGQPRTIDLNNPTTIDAETRNKVVQAIYHDQTPDSPTFITDVEHEELPTTEPNAE